MTQSKVLYSNSKKKFFVKDSKKDYHSQFGFVSKNDLAKESGSEVKTNKGTKMNIIDPFFIDYYEKIKRSAQIIPLKDIGYIISCTGINKTSRILDAGAGSGGLALMLANIAKKVYCFDIREDHIDIVKKNIEFIGLKNIGVKKGDICSDKLPKNIDVATIDIPEPWNALINVYSVLNPGGFFVSYSPCITQVSKLVDSSKEISGFLHIRTVEIIEREWFVEGQKVRPKSEQRISHSGFLTILRKVSK